MTDGRSKRWFIGDCQGDDYDAHFTQLAAAGENVHGEADFVEGLHPGSILDAGCGTGRVARELARRGFSVVGVDIDPQMLDTARRQAPHLEWHLGDLATIHLHRRFDAVVMAGNVMIFLDPGTEAAVVHNLTRHLVPGGLLIAGFQLAFSLDLAQYDDHAAAAGLRLTERWATWDRVPWESASTYAVSVHRREAETAATHE